MYQKSGWIYSTVEWSPKLAKRIKTEKLLSATHFVLPDLPAVFSGQDKREFFVSTSPTKRIQTIAACRYESARSLCNAVDLADKILVVGGNQKQNEAGGLSTIEAVKILRGETDTELWGVANPNDKGSLAAVNEKIEAGISGFITQPLLSSLALDTLGNYQNLNGSSGTSYVAGIAMPKSNYDLQFWLKLLEQPELEMDEIFKNHVAFFQDPNCSSLLWIQGEIQNLRDHSSIDGIHFMPIRNFNDLFELAHDSIDK